MDNAAILNTIQDVFRDNFNDDDLEIEATTTSEDVLDWDSLAHVRLILAIEKKFGCQFESTELEALQNVGDIVTTVQSKIG